MSELQAFGAYCRRMSTSVHTDGCPSLGEPSRPIWSMAGGDGMRMVGWTPCPPPCAGCVTTDDRELWALLADEIEDYLEHPPAALAGLFD